MSLLNKNSKIYVAGHAGLLGSSILNNLKSKGFTNIVTRTFEELDLRNTQAVSTFYAKEKPDVVFLAAAKVGGIHANNTYRADFIYENLQIQNNVIWGAHEAGTSRLIFLGSSCIYPKLAPQPMPETCLLSSELEYTNRPYAIAKIAGLELVNTLRQQYGRDYFSVMPTNQYGPGDNFHPENSHVLPALIRRFSEAIKSNASEIVIWGTGTPKREFMYAPDCADAIVYLAETLSWDKMQNSPVGNANWSHVNIGTGQEVSIKELAELIAKLTNYTGTLIFDTSKPDGTPRKLLDVSFLHNLGWKTITSLEEGLCKTIEWYNKQ